MNTKIVLFALLTLIGLVSECCYAQSKSPVPDEEQARKLTGQLRSQDWFPKSVTRRLQQVAAAIELLERSASVDRADAKYAILKAAQQFSDKAREWNLSRDILRQIDLEYQLDAAYLTEWYSMAIRQKQPEARITELVNLFSRDVTRPSLDADGIRRLRACEQQMQRKIQKSDGPFLQRWCFQKLAQSLNQLDLRDAQDLPLWQATSALVDQGDVSGGVEFLTKCDKPKIKKAATRLNDNKDDLDALIELISVLSSSGEANLQRAAKVLLKAKLQGMSLKQIGQAQEACFLEARQGLSPDLLLMFSGSAGNMFVEPSVENPQNLAYNEDEKALVGNGRFSVTYPLIPIVNFVHELEFTVQALKSGFRFRYGGYFANRLYFEPRENDQIKFTHRSAMGSRTTWNGSRTYTTGQKLRMTIYSICGEQYHVSNGRLVSQRSAPVQWLNYQLFNFGDSSVVMKKSTLRSWLPGDDRAFELVVNNPDLLKCTKPSEVEVDTKDIRSFVLGCDKLKDKPVTNQAFISGGEIVMQPVAGGTYARGETEVTISKEFWISRHEVTQLQWESVMKQNPGSIQGNSYFPIDNVSYDDISEFCKLLTTKAQKARRLKRGYVYRLPTESEWEYVATGDTDDEYSVGKEEFWHRGTSAARFHAVGTSKANRWGLYDLHGNVEEFVLDQFHRRPEKAPPAETDPVSIPESNGARIVCRGGSWYSPVDQCTSTVRRERTRKAAPYRGFRVVLGPAIDGS